MLLEPPPSSGVSSKAPISHSAPCGLLSASLVDVEVAIRAGGINCRAATKQGVSPGRAAVVCQRTQCWVLAVEIAYGCEGAGCVAA